MLGRGRKDQDRAKGLGKNIRRERALCGWTQEELGKQCDISRKIISNIERGENVPNAFQIHQIAQAFGTTVEALLEPGPINPDPTLLINNPELTKEC